MLLNAIVLFTTIGLELMSMPSKVLSTTTLLCTSGAAPFHVATPKSFPRNRQLAISGEAPLLQKTPAPPGIPPPEMAPVTVKPSSLALLSMSLPIARTTSP